MARVSLLRDEFLHQALIARTPPDRQPPPDFLLNLVHFLVQLVSRESISRSCSDGVHGGKLEKANGLLDMVDLNHRRKRHLSQGLGDTDDGFELTVATVRRNLGSKQGRRTEW